MLVALKVADAAAQNAAILKTAISLRIYAVIVVETTRIALRVREPRAATQRIPLMRPPFECCATGMPPEHLILRKRLLDKFVAVDVGWVVQRERVAASGKEWD